MENKPHLVKWEIVCSNKRKGLSKLNRALLGKWSWRFVEERGTLWKQVISRKYGIEEGGGVPEKPFNDWEMEMVERFLFSLQGKKVDTNMEDRVGGKRLRMIFFLLNPFIVLWRAAVQSRFRTALVLLLSVLWVLPSSVKEVLLGWHGSFVDKKRRKVLLPTTML
ncbi:hypothetical protein CK203_019778 [Vitis vinifera]|uniref:Uncharacterized protein n=1 Tax=Vitis vinifera TaxID=29760 RepID=A0A438JQL7_VITVI|nr:hypothetical protein CK203_019778 [Vitis vinifera]